MNDFENELKKQPWRPVPSHWRREILAAAKLAEADAQQRWSWWDLFWPSPKAWGGLGAAWMVLVGFNLATRDEVQPAETRAVAQMRTAMEQKRQLQAEMEEASLQVNNNEPPRPRSEAAPAVKSA